MKNKKECGEKMKRAREAAGLTQEELAALTGCSGPEISNYESGKISPRPDRLRKIAESLFVLEEYLTGEVPFPTLEDMKSVKNRFSASQMAAIKSFMTASGYKVVDYSDIESRYDVIPFECSDGVVRSVSFFTLANAAAAFAAIIESNMLPVSLFQNVESDE